MKTVLTLSDFEPDRARYVPTASNSITNALPVADGWGPIPSLEVFSSALAAEPRGAYTGVAPDGSNAAFAGTSTALYQLESDGTWTDVKSGTYNLPADDDWSFDIFNDRVIVTNSQDGVEYWDIGTSSAFATLPGSPPAAKYVRVIENFVVLGNISGTPNRIVWSGLGNSEQWTSGEELSAARTFPDGGGVQGIIDIKGGALIFQEYCIRQMQYAPETGYTFAFTYFDEKRGCVAPKSIVKIGSGDFAYLSREGFFRGNNPIGAEKVDGSFFELADPSDLSNVSGAADPSLKIIWWRAKAVDGTYFFYGYNWQLNRWFYSDTEVVGMAEMTTSAVTLEDLDTLYPGGMDSVTLNTDSTALSGGTPAFAGFNTSFELGYFTGVPQAATLETSTRELNPGRRSFARGADVVGDLGTSYTLQVGTMEYFDASEAFGSAVSPSSRTGMARFRSSGRMHRMRVNIPAGTNWTHVSGVRVDHTPAGKQ